MLCALKSPCPLPWEAGGLSAPIPAHGGAPEILGGDFAVPHGEEEQCRGVNGAGGPGL